MATGTLISGTGDWTVTTPANTALGIVNQANPLGPFGTPVPAADFALFPTIFLTVTLNFDGTTTVHIVGDDSTHKPNPVDSIGATFNLVLSVVNQTGHALSGLTFDLTNLSPDLPHNGGGSIIHWGEAVYDANYAYFTQVQPVSGESVALFQPDGTLTNAFGPAPSRLSITGNIANGATVVSNSVVHNTELTTPFNNDFDLSVQEILPAAADLSFQNADGTLVRWQMTGGTGLLRSDVVGPNPGPTWFAVGKGAFYTGDQSDVVWQNQNGTVVIWQVQGVQAIGGATVGNPGPTWHVEGTGDFNHDGHADIVLQNDNGSLGIWEMNGATFIGGGAVANPGPTWHVRGTGDFYADGHTDILWQNDDGSVAIWKMDGTSFIGGGGAGNPGASWHIKGTGDFNADGHTDILWQNDNGSVAIWEMNGISFIGGGPVGDPGPAWHVKATGDYNGDGRTDIALQNDDGTVATWEMNGASFIGGGPIGNPSTAWNLIDDNMRFIHSTSAGEILAASSAVPDEFVFTNFAAGAHTISGFNPMDDMIEFSKAQFASFAEVQAATTAVAGGAAIDLGGGSSLLLPGVDPGALHASNFALA
jgi:hypothetical protein